MLAIKRKTKRIMTIGIAIVAIVANIKYLLKVG